jgi:hypothetical protein
MATIAFDVHPTDPERSLGFEFWIDSVCVFDSDAVITATTVAHEFDDEQDGEHEFRMVLKNKYPNFTVLDDADNIVSDSTLALDNFRLEDIDITQIVYDRAVYRHDFNGSADAIDDQFFGIMGCNGTVSLQFTTPIYVWLLEVM